MSAQGTPMEGMSGTVWEGINLKHTLTPAVMSMLLSYAQQGGFMPLELTAEVGETEHTMTIAANTLNRYLATHYLNWSYMIDYMDAINSSSDFPSGLAPTVVGFYGLWNQYVSEYRDNWQRIYKALLAEYSPIANYDRTETGTNIKTYGRTDTETHNNYKETVNINQLTETDYGQGGYTETHTYSDTHSEAWNRTHKSGPMGATGDAIDGSYDGKGTTDNHIWTDDGSKKQVSQTVIRGADIDIDTGTANANTTSNSGSNSTTRSGKITTTEKTGTTGNTKEITGGKTNTEGGSDSESTNLHITGNIGVTTNQQMINEEIELRTKQSMLGIIMKGFANEYLFLAPEEGS